MKVVVSIELDHISGVEVDAQRVAEDLLEQVILGQTVASCAFEDSDRISHYDVTQVTLQEIID